MKLLQQCILVFTEGRSTKVYEVDLCDVGPERFVVNFRYGKRGSALKSGSKTVAPVGRAEAERVFAKLVESKLEQGYQREGAQPSEVTPLSVSGPDSAAPVSLPIAESARGAAERDPRGASLVRRLSAVTKRRWFGKPPPEKWRVDRMIWRAGELGLAQAEPALLALLGTAEKGASPAQGGKGIRDYSVAWALGRCGSSASLGALTALRADPKASEAVKRMAGEALLNLADPGTLREQALGQLPGTLGLAVRGEDPAAVMNALLEHLRGTGAGGLSVLERLYQVDGPAVRPALFAGLEACYRPGLFPIVRHLFKAAEYRRDAELFGRIALRFELEKPGLRGPSKEIAVTNPFSGERVILGALPPNATANSARPFTRVTRDYLRRRVWRTLRRLGQLKDPAYVPMAVGVLAPYTDQHAVRVRPAAPPAVGYDKFAPYLTFNHILYTNSPRYELPRNRIAWRTKGRYVPGEPAPRVREEAFPQLWEESPAGLMHLLAESRCGAVHEFAARALSDCPAFGASLDIDDLILLLACPYEVTAALGFRWVSQRADCRILHLGLIGALAQSVHQPARAEGFRRIEAERSSLAGESALWALLVSSRFADTRAFARRFLRSLTLPPQAARALAGRLVAAVLALGPESSELASDVVETLLLVLASHLTDIPLTVVTDLLAHPLAAVQELGAELLLKKDARSGLISEAVLLGILHSDHANVRAVGLRLVSELADETLIAMDPLLSHLSADANADVRNAARPLVARVAQQHPEFGEWLAQGLVESLLRRRLPEGAPRHLLSLLKMELAPSLAQLPKETVWRLLQSQSSEAQELGGILLPQRVEARELGLDQLAQLANHSILAVRQAAWHMLEQSAERVYANLAAVVRVVEADWEDSRAWALDLFRAKAPPEAFTAEVLITLVDCVGETAQSLGCELLQKHFSEADGPELLRKLSEHPTRQVQLFTTNYLDRYAGGSLEELKKLSPYFVSVFSRVNQGRIAKARVLDFLGKEALRAEDIAELVVGLLHRWAATLAIGDRGAVLQRMVAIHRQWPNLSLPLRFIAPESRACPQGQASGAGE